MDNKLSPIPQQVFDKNHFYKMHSCYCFEDDSIDWILELFTDLKNQYGGNATVCFSVEHDCDGDPYDPHLIITTYRRETPQEVAKRIATEQERIVKEHERAQLNAEIRKKQQQVTERLEYEEYLRLKEKYDSTRVSSRERIARM